jgi:hypothetical protein
MNVDVTGVDAQLIEKGATIYPQLATEVWISREAQQDQALELVRKLYSNDPEARSWTCTHCDESNPATFELCWSCGQVHL